MQREPDHPIIERPWEYDIAEFYYRNDLEQPERSFIDLVLQKGTSRRRLRFLCPSSLTIESGFPCATRGMAILDVRSWQWENVSVRVADFENSSGAITFNAREVIDLDVSNVE